METFFTKDKNFYKVFFRLMLVVALQNLVAYSVNMLDNMMLGSYDQNALSGAATVNQIFFVVNQLAIAIGNALIVMSSQYWGKKDTYSKKAYPWDNACIESFHSLIKREWLNRFKIRDYEHAYRLIFEYLEAFYNTKRIHSHCDYMSPNDYEELYRRLQQGELQMAG